MSKHGSFTSSHGFKKGQVITFTGACTKGPKSFIVTSVTATIADLKPYRWYHRIWYTVKGWFGR